MGGPLADERTIRKLQGIREVWRVNPNGELQDTFKRLTAVFEMKEEEFFLHYSSVEGVPRERFLQNCIRQMERLEPPSEKLPFSNVYMASVISKRLPAGSLVHIGLSTSLRAWNLFEFAQGVASSANRGACGIDGVLATFIGASLADKNRLCYCVLGDLSFFYGMNVLNNEVIGPNVRILLINDNGGGLMKMNESPVHRFIGDAVAEEYLVAGGHFGGKESSVVQAYAEALGFEYLQVSDKESFDKAAGRFVMPEMTAKPMLLEAFTNVQEERAAFEIMESIDVSVQGTVRTKAKKLLGPKGIGLMKKVIRSGKK